MYLCVHLSITHRLKVTIYMKHKTNKVKAVCVCTVGEDIFINSFAFNSLKSVFKHLKPVYIVSNININYLYTPLY